MSTIKSTNRKKNFSNPFGSLADPSAHIQTNKQTKSLYYIDRFFDILIFYQFVSSIENNTLTSVVELSLNVKN